MDILYMLLAENQTISGRKSLFIFKKRYYIVAEFNLTKGD